MCGQDVWRTQSITFHFSKNSPKFGTRALLPLFSLCINKTSAGGLYFQHPHHSYLSKFVGERSCVWKQVRKIRRIAVMDWRHEKHTISAQACKRRKKLARKRFRENSRDLHMLKKAKWLLLFCEQAVRVHIIHDVALLENLYLPTHVLFFFCLFDINPVEKELIPLPPPYSSSKFKSKSKDYCIIICAERSPET
jgi:hypothetical protein